MALPVFGYFPALRLTQEIQFGEWWVGPMPPDATWRNTRFEQLARGLLAALEKEGFGAPAVLWHRKRGFDGDGPDLETAAAIQTAVRFAVLDANDQSEGSLNRGRVLATAENGVFYLQPIDEENGWLTQHRGGALNEVMIGGWRIGDQSPSLPDAVVAIEPVRASSKLAGAVFSALRKPARRARRLRVAIEWHAAAMANPRAVTWQQRIIALKTGFESLLGTSNSRDGAKRLRTLFEDATAASRSELPWAGLLWSPRERIDLARTYRKGGVEVSEVRSELEDWFMTLAAARNAIIHDGALPLPEYAAPLERPLSRYKGHLFWIGERILREAVKAKMGPEILLCSLLAERRRLAAFANELLPELEHLASTIESGEPLTDDAQPIADAASPPRSLEDLLELLACGAANEVSLSPHHAEPDGRLWEATAGNRSEVVEDAEKSLLEAAGAEEALRNWIEPCP